MFAKTSQVNQMKENLNQSVSMVCWKWVVLLLIPLLSNAFEQYLHESFILQFILLIQLYACHFTWTSWSGILSILVRLFYTSIVIMLLIFITHTSYSVCYKCIFLHEGKERSIWTWGRLQMTIIYFNNYLVFHFYYSYFIFIFWLWQMHLPPWRQRKRRLNLSETANAKPATYRRWLINLKSLKNKYRISMIST